VVLRSLYLALAGICLALGVLGIFLPGLPTTPFVLVAAWAAARGSTRLHRWLRTHRVFGPIVSDWEREGAVTRKAKRTAIVTMVACAVVLFLTAPAWWMAAIPCVIMGITGTWLWRRPEPAAMQGMPAVGVGTGDAGPGTR
jgi:uncharacterized membrane protein YbaN (DUF454 family)